MAECPAPPEGLRLGPQELLQRQRVMTEGGPLAASMRSLEARTWTPVEWLAEAWLWVLFLLIVRGSRAETTVSDYAGHLGRFADWVMDQGIGYAELTPAQLDAWQRWLYIHRRNGAQMRRAALMAVRSFYTWRSSRVGGADVTEGYRPPKRVTKAPRKYAPKQLRDLFAAARQASSDLAVLRDTAVLLVLLAAGLRREELATLRIDQLELGHRSGVIHVFGKGSKERHVPIEGPVVSTLIEWLDQRRDIAGLDTDAVFVTLAKGGKGRAMSTRSVEAIVERCAKRAGFREWGVHRFRVTFATLLYDDGTDIERIRVLMGHESIETTRRYISISDRMNRYRLKAHRQHAAMGTAPVGLPLWAQELEKEKNGR